MDNSGHKTRYYWRPLSLNELFSNFSLNSLKLLLPVLGWALLICACLFIINELMPVDWLIAGGDKMDITTFFIIYPSYIIGLLLLFWAGFEWGFVPLFISSFALGFHSGMDITWSIIFGLSFVFGLAIFGLAYQSLRIPFDLRDFKSVGFFISVSFIASLASSMGAFIWSLSHYLSAYETAIIWKSWWTGIFFQSILVTGPLLLLFTPAVEDAKQRFYPSNAIKKVSLTWIHLTVSIVTGILVGFIFAGKLLGIYRVNEVLDQLPNVVRGDVIGALDSFEIIIWLSIGLITVTGYTAIYLISRWNKELRQKVQTRTKKLEESKQKLQASLQEKKLMLKETHHRVKNSLAQVSGLLQLQMMTVDDEKYTQLIQDSDNRIHAMSLIHQALYDTEDYSSISLAEYLENLGTIIYQSFRSHETEIETKYRLIKYSVDTQQAVTLGLIVTEILINAYKYAFQGQANGTLIISLEQKGDKLLLTISDDGSGLPEKNTQEKATLGMDLIRKFSQQLDAELSIDSGSKGTSFSLLFDPAT